MNELHDKYSVSDTASENPKIVGAGRIDARPAGAASAAGAAVATADACNPRISRRGFILSALGTAGTCLAGAALLSNGNKPAFASGAEEAGAADVPDASGGNPAPTKASLSTEALAVSSDSVFTTSDCEYVEDVTGELNLVSSIHLPYQTLLWAGDSDVAACLLPCDTSTPLTKLGLIALATGEYAVALDEPIGVAEGFQIFDVRANKDGAIWLESNVADNEWRIYTAPVILEGGAKAPKLGEAALAASGNSDWYPPDLGVSGAFALWQISPDPDGACSEESSVIMRIGFGDSADNAKAVCESHGQFACAPSTTSISDEAWMAGGTADENGGASDLHCIVCAPRTSSSSTQYQLTLIDTSSGQIVETLILPASMRPAFIAYGKTGFSFAFDGIYSFGDGISGLGTYTCASNANGDTSGTAGEWYRCDRSPYADPAWCGKWFAVKSSSAIALVDLIEKRYTTITPEHVTQGYGEFLVSSGTASRFVTYSNIDYTPIGGSQIRECNVRVWSA